MRIQSTSVSESLTTYIAHLNAKGNTPDCVRHCEQRLTKLLKGTKTIGDLDAGPVLTTLAKWKRTLSLGTLNHYVRAVKRFVKWLYRSRYLTDDPMRELQTFNAKTDRRQVRRPFTKDELSKLIDF
ncbi:MAG: hypothetical protein ACK5Q5_19315 [Planctomycetaceae bacterium]